MQIENQLDVPISMEQAWELFTRVDRVAPCMPGAELIEVMDDGTYRGRVSVRLGPIRLRFDGDARFKRLDESIHEAVILAKGRESTGKGNAEALITSRLTPHNGATRVSIVTELKLTGPIAQYGRQGVISDVSSQLIDEFAQCLRAQLTGTEEQAKAAVERRRDVKGLSVALKALWTSLVRGIKGLLRGRKSR